MGQKRLYDHVPAPHQPQSIEEHATERRQKSNAYTRVKEWVALKISTALGTMECAFLFVCLATYGFPQNPTPATLVQWISQTLIQLTALSVLGLGQQIASRISDYVTQQIYKIVHLLLHIAEQIKNHLHAQDHRIIAIDHRIATVEKQCMALKQQSDLQAKLITQLIQMSADRDDAMAGNIGRIFDLLNHLSDSSHLSFLSRFKPKQKVGKH